MPQAYLLAVRKNQQNQQNWEILLAQKHVIDYQHTLEQVNSSQPRPDLFICNNPGDYIIPGGGLEQQDQNNLATTALREFCEETKIRRPALLQNPPQATLQRFFQKSSQNRILAEFYLMRADQNQWMTLYDDNNVTNKNQEFTRLENAVVLQGNQQKKFVINNQRNIPNTNFTANSFTELHQLLWVPLAQVFNLPYYTRLDQNLNNINQWNPLWRSNQWMNLDVWQSTQYQVALDYSNNRYGLMQPDLRACLIRHKVRQDIDWFVEALKHLVDNHANILPNNPPTNQTAPPNYPLSQTQALWSDSIQPVFPGIQIGLNYALSNEPLLLNGMKVIFDQPVGVYPVTLESKEEERRNGKRN